MRTRLCRNCPSNLLLLFQFVKFWLWELVTWLTNLMVSFDLAELYNNGKVKKGSRILVLIWDLAEEPTSKIVFHLSSVPVLLFYSSRSLLHIYFYNLLALCWFLRSTLGTSNCQKCNNRGIIPIPNLSSNLLCSLAAILKLPGFCCTCALNKAKTSLNCRTS